MIDWNELKTVKANQKLFRVIEGGWKNWKFDELVECNGLEKAIEIAEQYAFWNENCLLRNDMRRLQDGDGYQWKISRPRHTTMVVTDLQGVILTIEDDMKKFVGLNIKEILKTKQYIYTYNKTTVSKNDSK